MIITKETLSISNPSFKNIPATTVEDTARRGARFSAAQRRASRARAIAAKRDFDRRTKEAQRRGFASIQAEDAFKREQARKAAQRAAAERERIRKGRISEVVLERGRDETVLIPEVRQVVGASPRAIAAARRRGRRRGARLVRALGRTAARRGRKQRKVSLRKTTVKVGARTCKARFAQDVGSVTKAEAQCELAAQKVGEKSRRTATGRINLTRRQAGLLNRLQSTRTVGATKGRRGRRSGGRRVTTRSRGGFDIPTVLFTQASQFARQEAKIERNKVTVGVGAGRFRRTARRAPRGSGAAFSLARGKSNFILTGRGSGADFEKDLIRQFGARRARSLLRLR